MKILLQNNVANQKRLGQMNGVDVVLQAVAMYKSRDPGSLDEEEMERTMEPIVKSGRDEIRVTEEDPPKI
ncbi:hypothetical protein L1987_15152 [Smallanthus sonchifolius]|uniref:Uncharacterized protein n=1 Tax=Smallanthus sonchifolius TaxID=185202 RepID=A0ACB9J4U5_9ASTR|nr:hypothetical protein L1987_15152 [Smallanthus sonchifolius]